jgi:chromosome partitioning protein
MASGLTLKGFRCLSTDLDAQGNMTYTVNGNTDGATVLGVLMGEVKPFDAIQHTDGFGDIIVSSKALSGADGFITVTGKEYRLKEALEKVCDMYDYIIIDTPPALGILTVNALTACHSVIIPAQAEIYSLQGIEQLSETMKPVRKYCNPRLDIAGILLTRYSQRTVLSREVAEMAKQLAQKLGTKIFSTSIRENISVKEAQISQKSLFEYAPNSNAAKDYAAFIEELLSD